MQRTRFIEHNGKRILFFDFSNVTDVEEGLRILSESKAVVAQEPEKSLRTLVDIAGSRFDRRITEGLRDLSAHNKPYVFANATVGFSGMQKMLVKTTARLTGRKLNLFDDIETAKDWLAQQEPVADEVTPD